MTQAPPAAPPAPVPVFTPVQRRFARHDGWTVARQRGFIAALASLGCVKRAAAAVSMSSEGAYALRIAPGATSLAAAWTAALDQGAERLVEIAMQRAVVGSRCRSCGTANRWLRSAGRHAPEGGSQFDPDPEADPEPE